LLRGLPKQIKKLSIETPYIIEKKTLNILHNPFNRSVRNSVRQRKKSLRNRELKELKYYLKEEKKLGVPFVHTK
jgi:hypothetical protein